MNKLMKTTLNILTSVYSPALIVKYLKKWGVKPFYHSYFIDNKHYQNGWGHYHYGFRFGNLYLERKLAIDTTIKATYNINEFFNCHYKIQKLAHNSKTPDSTSGLYTLLIYGADGKIDRNKIIVRDKRNNREVYNLYQTLIRSIYKYINRKSNDRALLIEQENPWHYKKRIFSHPHLHGLLLLQQQDITKINKIIRNKFIKVFKYKPIKCEIRPLYWKNHNPEEKINLNTINHNIIIDVNLNKLQRVPNLSTNLLEQLKRGRLEKNKIEVNKKTLKGLTLDLTIYYFLKDRKIQTKDTDEYFFDGIHSSLRYNQLHLTFNAQLNSAKGHRQAYYVSNQTINSELKKIHNMKNTLNKKKSALIKKQTKKDNLKNTQKNIKQVIIRQKEVHNFQQLHNNLTYINSGKISKSKKVKKSTHFHFKYSYKYTTSGIPP